MAPAGAELGAALPDGIPVTLAISGKPKACVDLVPTEASFTLACTDAMGTERTASLALTGQPAVGYVDVRVDDELTLVGLRLLYERNVEG